MRIVLGPGAHQGTLSYFAAEPEDTDHQNGATSHGRVQALLRGWESVPLLDETKVCVQEPEVQKGSEDGTYADADEDKAVVHDRKVARTYEDHGKRLRHCATKPGSEIVRLLYRDDGTCVDDTIGD
jgi:hypothetical protein